MKWGMWKYLKVSPRNLKLHKYRLRCQPPVLNQHCVDTFQRFVQRSVTQNMVLHRALHPLTQKKLFFLRGCHCQCTLSEQDEFTGIIVWFGKVIANALAGKQNPWYFIWMADAELILPESSLLLCSYILGMKEKLGVLVPSDCHEQWKGGWTEGGRNECSPYKEKAAVPLTMIRGFSALGLLGFNIYPWLLAETRSERHSTDETKALNLSNSQFQVQHLGQILKWDQEPRAERPGDMYWAGPHHSCNSVKLLLLP